MPFDVEAYGPEWPIVRQKILARDNPCCKNCGLRDYSVIYRKDDGSFELWWVATSVKEGREAAKRAEMLTGKKHSVVVLSVAHLDDPDPRNVADSNVALLCEYCHGVRDKYMRAKNRRATWKRRREEAEAARQLLWDARW